jgi:hypothetical protein
MRQAVFGWSVAIQQQWQNGDNFKLLVLTVELQSPFGPAPALSGLLRTDLPAGVQLARSRLRISGSEDASPLARKKQPRAGVAREHRDYITLRIFSIIAAAVLAGSPLLMIGRPTTR